MKKAIIYSLLSAGLCACSGGFSGADTEVASIVVSEDATPEERAALLAAAAEFDSEQDAVAEPETPRRGLFAFLRADPEKADAIPEASPEQDDEPATETALPDETVYEAEPEKAQRRVFAFLRRNPDKDASAEPVTADMSVAEAPEEMGVTSDLAPQASAIQDAPMKIAEAPRAGQVLPFGEVAEVCGVPRKDMGKEIDTYPSDGRTMYRLLDTEPNSTAPRTQYITGLKRGCALQVTASLVLFGSPAAHEIHRYGAAMKGAPYSKADTKYEQVKAQICGVSKGERCTGSGANRIGRKVAFVSVYRQFGQPTGWLELMLNDGRLVTKDMR